MRWRTPRSRQVRRQHVRREPGLLLVEIDGDELEAHGGLALQREQHVEQRVGILAAGQADHDDGRRPRSSGSRRSPCRQGREARPGASSSGRTAPARRLRDCRRFGARRRRSRSRCYGRVARCLHERGAMIASARRIRHNARVADRDDREACEAYHCNGSRFCLTVRALDYVNRSAMKRAVIALVLALAALALLISLALESRSLPVETHVAQYTIAGDLERLNGDFRALVDTLQSAWNEQTPPGEGARALLERVAAQPQQLPESLFTMQGSASQEARLSNSHATFIGAVGDATALAGRADRRSDGLRGRGLVLARVGRRRHPRAPRRKASTARPPTRSSSSSARSTSPARTHRFAPARSIACSSTLGRDQRVDSMPGDVRRAARTPSARS